MDKGNASRREHGEGYFVSRNDREELVIIAFDGITTNSEASFTSAASRVLDSISGGAVAVVVCAEPIAMANHLAHAGLRAVTIPSHNQDPQLVSELAGSGITPVLEGAADEAIDLARQLLRADVIIYTAGKVLMSGDPQRVAGARRIERANHLEILELTAPVEAPMRLRTAEEARNHGIPYEIRNVIDDSATIVRQDGYEDRTCPVVSISVARGFAFVSIRPDESEETVWAARRTACLARLAERNISFEMAQFVSSRFRFVIGEELIGATQEVIRECDLAWRLVPNCSKICVVGSGIRTTAGIFLKSFAGLAARDIPVLHYSDSNVTMSLLVSDVHAAEAEAFLHDALAPGGGSAEASPITFDSALGRVRVNGRERRLGARQAKLLQFLLDNVGRIVEVEEAAKHVFGRTDREDVGAIRVHMHNLRKKIEDDPDNPRYLVTVPSQGYLFVR